MNCNLIRIITLWILSLILCACATNTPAVNGKKVPAQKDSNSISQFIKSDVDRMADVEVRENIQSLRLLMTKLYKRNPSELKKSTSGTVEEMVDWVFEGDHQWKFEAIGGVQDLDAMYLAFKPEYTGDRVLPFIVGIQTMLIKARGGKREFFILDNIDPQKIYNSARNIEIAVWKLSNTKDENGRLFFVTNEIVAKEPNLSFEREFGKMVGRIDLYALTIAEKNQRVITRVTQGVAGKLFIPF
jgi:hypothetical protein